MTDSALANEPNIRELLNKTFTEEALTILCFDHFLAVYRRFVAGMNKQQKIRRLVTYCEGRGQVDALLSQVRAYRPAESPSAEERRSVKPTQPVPDTASAPSPRLTQLKLEALEETLETLVKQYKAANQQLRSTLSAVDKVTIQQQIADLEQQMQAVEAEINQLRTS